eukprot:scaffold104683_cov34-Prasinocladus_malaysianus.AAC.1
MVLCCLLVRHAEQINSKHMCLDCGLLLLCQIYLIKGMLVHYAMSLGEISGSQDRRTAAADMMLGCNEGSKA